MLRMLDGDAAQVVHACGDRRTEGLGNLRNGGLGSALPDAVARVYERTLSLVERERDSLHVVVGRVSRPDLGYFALDYLGIHRRRAEHTVVNGEMYGANRGRGCNPQRALDGGGKTLRFDDRPVLLGHGRGDGRWPEAMAEVEAYPVREAAGVPGEGYHHDWKAAPPDVDELPHALGKTGSEVNDHDSRVGVYLGVSARHCGHGTFVQPQDAVDVRVGVQCVEEQCLA